MPLYLHHLALGENDAADRLHQQTDDVTTPADDSDQPPRPTEPSVPPW